MTTVAILAFVQALFLVALGAALVAERTNPEVRSDFADSVVAAVAGGVVLILLGVLGVVVVGALWVGRAWARLVVSGLEVLNVALAIRLTLTRTGGGFWSGILQICLALFVLVLLYSGRSDDFFTGRRRRSGRD